MRERGGQGDWGRVATLFATNFAKLLQDDLRASSCRRITPHVSAFALLSLSCAVSSSSSPLPFLLPPPFLPSLSPSASLRFFPVKPTLFAQNFRFKVCLLFTCVASLRTRTDRETETEKEKEREGKQGQCEVKCCAAAARIT